MKNITIEEQKDSPCITLNADENFMEIKGSSYMSNTFEFYLPTLNWLKEYFSTKHTETNLHFRFKYFNSATHQVVFEILDIIQNSKSENTTISWYYIDAEDDAYDDYLDLADEYPELRIVAVQY